MGCYSGVAIKRPHVFLLWEAMADRAALDWQPFSVYGLYGDTGRDLDCFEEKGHPVWRTWHDVRAIYFPVRIRTCTFPYIHVDHGRGL